MRSVLFVQELSSEGIQFGWIRIAKVSRKTINDHQKKFIPGTSEFDVLYAYDVMPPKQRLKI
jgi:hypothetical protein